ncbi:hypothetical protein FVE85_0745 [Porphyridium purpureum]|uniref:Uncharacterized protein n=1 Tax=Porphyridium purpureum TaxID=35688 RepID=A0A5J4Z074_PORPP|nr:hypothetical protein FVE85_0745 [Porphyridium purpureum]|eukprot:POR5045..scf208_2
MSVPKQTGGCTADVIGQTCTLDVTVVYKKARRASLEVRLSTLCVRCASSRKEGTVERLERIQGNTARWILSSSLMERSSDDYSTDPRGQDTEDIKFRRRLSVLEDAVESRRRWIKKATDDSSSQSYAVEALHHVLEVRPRAFGSSLERQGRCWPTALRLDPIAETSEEMSEPAIGSLQSQNEDDDLEGQSELSPSPSSDDIEIVQSCTASSLI